MMLFFGGGHSARPDQDQERIPSVLKGLADREDRAACLLSSDRLPARRALDQGKEIGFNGVFARSPARPGGVIDHQQVGGGFFSA